MANPEHLDILKQGVEVWNKWREENPDELRPDLSGADLRRVQLRGIDFSETDLSMANLSGSDLSKADLHTARLTSAHLIQAHLVGASFLTAFLKNADLSKAELSSASFFSARLVNSNLRGANLTRTDFTQAKMSGSDLSGALLLATIFDFIDLRHVRGLENVVHAGPSTIGIEAIYHSQGQIPEIFLRNAGVPDSFLEIMHSIVNRRPIEYYTCFISYSSKDQTFAERLHTDLQTKGVRCWFAPEDMKIGDIIRPRIDESIRLYDKLLLILSQNSVTSEWVEYEVETALAKERKEKKIVLFPVRLDKTVMESPTAWASHIQNTRHIGDFTRWKRHDEYQKAFDRLLRDLKAEAEKDV